MARDQQLGVGQLPLERRELGEGAPGVVARPVGEIDPLADALELDPDRVVAAVHRHVARAEGDHIGHAGALEQIVHRLAEVVEVAIELAPGLIGHQEQAVMAAAERLGVERGAGDPRLGGIAGGGQAPDVDRVDGAVAAIEALQHRQQAALDVGGAEALLGVDPPGLAELGALDDLLDALGVLGAEDDVGVEALREEDDLLAARDAVQELGQAVEIRRQVDDLLFGLVAVRASVHRGEVLELLHQHPHEGLAHVQVRGALALATDEGLALGGGEIVAEDLFVFDDGEAQRIAEPFVGIDQAEIVERRHQLRPVAGEAHQDLDAAAL